MLMLQTIMGEIEEVINTKLIPRFIDWNFDSGKYPRFQFGSLTEEQKSALVDIFKTLAVAGQSLTIRPEFVHELEKQVAEEFGLEIDWNAIEDEMAQEKEQQKLLEEQQQQQQMMSPDMSVGSPGPGGAPGTPGLGPAAAPGSGPMVGPAPFPGGSTDINPALVPEGFVLSNASDEPLTLSDMAAQLLDDAMLELVRGRPNSGGPKFIRTAEGARVYGAPIGTPITRDMENRAGARGVEGKSYGAGRVRKDDGTNSQGSGNNSPGGGNSQGGGKGSAPTDASISQGGGTGAKPQNPGSVNVDGGGATKAQRILSNPQEPGAQLIDYGDGTVAIRDAHGSLSPRQRFNIDAFVKFGWKVDSSFGGAKDTGTKAAAGTKAADAKAADTKASDVKKTE
jgi:hypothetical protein